jgi:presenilin enhancer 2
MLVRGAFTLEKAETVCRWYFRLGFLGLPWLWGVLYLFFSHYQHESEAVCWYVGHARLYSLCGAVVFVAVTLGLLVLLPASSPLWVIAPYQDTFQWGLFAANMSANASSGTNSSSSSGGGGGGAALLL